MHDKGKDIFVSVVEPKLGLLEVEMKVLARNTSVVIEPSLGVGEEALNAVDVGSSIHPEDQPLSFSSPTSFALPFPAKEGLIELKFSGEGLHFGERSVIDGFPEEPKSSVGGGEIVGKVKPCSVAWNTQTEEVAKMYDFVKGDASRSFFRPI
ncbi:MAG: hypothetical protein QME54_05735 [Actinomycetota bacterium]|nr:hypothetical protein [Actinomycetota bacterium]